MAGTFKLQIKGLIRFSYLSLDGFKASEKGVDAVRASLYAPERLERRFRFFEALALPSLREQENQDFQTAILVGESFPIPYLERLLDLLDDVPNTTIVRLPPLIHIQAVKTAYRALPTEEAATHIATFRLDDDDAMHRTTTARIAEIAEHSLPLRDADSPFAIAFNRGFYLDTANDDQPVREVYERNPLGIGMALVASKNDAATVFRRNHRQVTQYYNTYSDVSRPMFLRSVHDDNDSGAKASGRDGKMEPQRIERLLRDGFGLNVNDLRTL